jgi:hypothetical protein
MNKDDNPIAAFGSIEEGDEPLQPYIDPVLFDTIDRQVQIELLTRVFDAITIAGVDYDLQVQEGTTGKRYTLLKNNDILKILFMDSDFADLIVESINSQEDSL